MSVRSLRYPIKLAVITVVIAGRGSAPVIEYSPIYWIPLGQSFRMIGAAEECSIQRHMKSETDLTGSKE